MARRSRVGSLKLAAPRLSYALHRAQELAYFMERTPLELPPQPSTDLTRGMLGLWRLLSREDHDQSGARNIDPIMGPNPIGLLCFGSTHFAAQFMNPDRSSSPATPAATGANNSGAVNGYDAYFGTYTIDATAGTVTVQLEGALSPANIGQAFVRDIRVDDHRLWIQLKTKAVNGTPITRTLVFARDG